MKKKKEVLSRCALLDASGIYQGMVDVTESEITDLHLPEIKECDLPIGRYQWCKIDNTFKPMPRAKKQVPASTQRDMIRGLLAMQKHGYPLTEEQVALVDSFDAKGLK